jgi:hypothetical protein
MLRCNTRIKNFETERIIFNVNQKNRSVKQLNERGSQAPFKYSDFRRACQAIFKIL